MRISFTLFTLFLFLYSQAADRYWVGAIDNSWKNPLNWSSTSGGSTDTILPGQGSFVIFDDSSNQSCIADTIVEIQGITLTDGFGDSLVLTGLDFNVSDTFFTQLGGVFIGDTSYMKLHGGLQIQGGQFHSTSELLEVGKEFRDDEEYFYHNSGSVHVFTNGSIQKLYGDTVRFNDLIIGSDSINQVITVTTDDHFEIGGTLYFKGSRNTQLNTGAFTVIGDIEISNSNLSSGGSAWVIVNGDGKQSLSSTSNLYRGGLPKLLVQKSETDTFEISGKVAIDNAIQIDSGYCHWLSGSSLYLKGSTAASGISRAIQLYLGNNYVTTTISIDSDNEFYIDGNLNFIGTKNVTVNGGSLYVPGNIEEDNYGQNGGGTARLTFIGDEDCHLIGDSWQGKGKFGYIEVAKDSGSTVYFQSNIDIVHGIIVTSGSFQGYNNDAAIWVTGGAQLNGNMSLPTLRVGSVYVNSIISLNPGDTISVTNSLILSGSKSLKFNNGVFRLKGNINQGNNSSSNDAGTSTFLIDGNGNQSIIGNSNYNRSHLPDVIIKKPDTSILYLRDYVNVSGDWKYISGDLNSTSYSNALCLNGNSSLSGNQTIKNLYIGRSSTEQTFTVDSSSVITVTGLLRSQHNDAKQTISGGKFVVTGRMLINNNQSGSRWNSSIEFQPVDTSRITGHNETYVRYALGNVTVNGDSLHKVVRTENKVRIDGNLNVVQGQLIQDAGTKLWFGDTATIDLEDSINGYVSPMDDIVLTSNSSRRISGVLRVRGGIDLGTSNLDIGRGGLQLDSLGKTHITSSGGFIYTSDSTLRGYIQRPLDTSVSSYTFPWYSKSGDSVFVEINLDSMNLDSLSGVLRVFTYGTNSTDSINNRPLPPLVSELLNDSGDDNSQNMVDRYWKIAQIPEGNDPYSNFNLRLNFSNSESGGSNSFSVSTLKLQEFDGSTWGELFGNETNGQLVATGRKLEGEILIGTTRNSFNEFTTREYATLKKQLDAGYYYMLNNIRFKYEEKYNSNELDYTIYDWQRNDVLSGTIASNNHGTNFHIINAGSSLVKGKYYILEIENPKGEEWLMRFYYNWNSASSEGNNEGSINVGVSGNNTTDATTYTGTLIGELDNGNATGTIIGVEAGTGDTIKGQFTGTEGSPGQISGTFTGVRIDSNDQEYAISGTASGAIQ